MLVVPRGTTASAPSTRTAASTAQWAPSGELTTGGVRSPQATAACRRWAAAMAKERRSTSPTIRSRAALVVARTVPRRIADSGMMFGAVPACTMPTVTTPGCAGSSRREMMVCSAVTSAARPTTGSADSWGRAPWAPAPVSVIVKESVEAASGPAWATTCPTSKRRSTCAPKMARTPSSAPLSSTSAAPCPTSSAGCSTTSTSPSAGVRCRSRAAPTAQDACTSWPQACMTPSLREAYGSPVAS